MQVGQGRRYQVLRHLQSLPTLQCQGQATQHTQHNRKQDLKTSFYDNAMNVNTKEVEKRQKNY